MVETVDLGRGSVDLRPMKTAAPVVLVVLAVLVLSGGAGAQDGGWTREHLDLSGFVAPVFNRQQLVAVQSRHTAVLGPSPSQPKGTCAPLL